MKKKDRRKGFIAGYKKSGPVGRFMVQATIVGIIIGIVGLIISIAPKSQNKYLNKNNQNLQNNYTPIIKFSPNFRGALVVSDLLSVEGTIHFKTKLKDLLFGNEVYFEIYDNDFYFSLILKPGKLILKRNKHEIALDISQVPKELDEVRIIAIWGYEKLYLMCGNGSKFVSAQIQTQITFPSKAMIKWAKEQNLLSTDIYKSEDAFRARIYAILETVKEKIKKIDLQNAFWNIQYENNIDISRSPKGEKDIKRIVYAILFDQALIGNIEVVQDYNTQEGIIDFVMIGQVKNIGSSKVAIDFDEFCNKETQYILIKELAGCLEKADISYAAICLLWFKGEWYNEPKEYEDFDSADFNAKLLLRNLDYQSRNKLRIFSFDLTTKEK